MTTYVLRRMLLTVPTVLLVLFMTFLIIRLVPGNVVEIMMAERPYATEGDRAALENQLGLDDPIPVQFSRYLWDVARGDLGTSPWTTLPVRSELRRRLPVTAEFAAYSILWGLLVALPVGVLSAVRQNTAWDYLARSAAILALSVPYFFTSTLIIVLGPRLGWAPPLVYRPWSDGPVAHVSYFLVPALLLGLSLGGGVMRMTRAMMLEVLRQDYIRTAWAKGLRERAVIVRHALRNALIPVITMLGLQASTALGGTIILETIWNMPGVGRFFVGSILQRDYPSVQGVVLVLAVVVVLVNLGVDLTYAWLDPRIRYG